MPPELTILTLAALLQVMQFLLYSAATPRKLFSTARPPDLPDLKSLH